MPKNKKKVDLSESQKLKIIQEVKENYQRRSR